MNIHARPRAVKVMNLLAACSLPNSDISARKLEHFFGCGDEGDPRGAGCGKRLVQEAEQYAARSGVKRLYLMTTTAEKFFQSLGYRKLERGAVPEAIRATTEFSSLCPASAAVMVKAL